MRAVCCSIVLTCGTSSDGLDIRRLEPWQTQWHSCCLVLNGILHCIKSFCLGRPNLCRRLAKFFWQAQLSGGVWRHPFRNQVTMHTPGQVSLRVDLRIREWISIHTSRKASSTLCKLLARALRTGLRRRFQRMRVHKDIPRSQKSTKKTLLPRSNTMPGSRIILPPLLA